jgi:hypothetical protein
VHLVERWNAFKVPFSRAVELLGSLETDRLSEQRREVRKEVAPIFCQAPELLKDVVTWAMLLAAECLKVDMEQVNMQATVLVDWSKDPLEIIGFYAPDSA